MKKVIFKKEPDDVIYAEDIDFLYNSNYAVGAISDYGVKALIAWYEESEKYKMVSIQDMEIFDLDFINFQFLAFDTDNELLEWLKEGNESGASN